MGKKNDYKMRNGDKRSLVLEERRMEQWFEEGTGSREEFFRGLGIVQRERQILVMGERAMMEVGPWGGDGRILLERKKTFPLKYEGINK